VIRPTLVLVTDSSFGDDRIVRCVEQAGAALPTGALTVQLRDKARGLGSLRLFASRLRVATRAVGASLVVNGRPEVARDVGADGVHLGAGAGSIEGVRLVFPRAWISVATHSDDDVRRAVGEGADAVVVSPIFASRPPGTASTTKEGRGLPVLRSARGIAGRATVIALGGVDAHNAGACGAAGAHAVAVMKALLASASPGRVARAIHDAIAPRW
jgi:thiamine-phosphate pyrophosphorylase